MAGIISIEPAEESDTNHAWWDFEKDHTMQKPLPSYSIDQWSEGHRANIETLAYISDFEVAVSANWLLIRKKPDAIITLRQGARMLRETAPL